MHVRVGAACAAEDFRGAIGQHLVGVHVVRRAGAGLIDVDHELIAELPAEHFVRGRDDRVRPSGRQPIELSVRLGGGALDQDGRADEAAGRGQPADLEILSRARRLHAVVGVGGNVEVAEWIAFDAKGTWKV